VEGRVQSRCGGGRIPRRLRRARITRTTFLRLLQAGRNGRVQPVPARHRARQTAFNLDRLNVGEISARLEQVYGGLADDPGGYAKMASSQEHPDAPVVPCMSRRTLRSGKATTLGNQSNRSGTLGRTRTIATPTADLRECVWRLGPDAPGHGEIPVGFNVGQGR